MILMDVRPFTINVLGQFEHVFQLVEKAQSNKLSEKSRQMGC